VSAFLIANMAPIMFAALIVFLLLGYPVAFALAANGIFFGLLGIQLGLLEPSLFQALPERMWGVMSNDTLLAVPFFTFMGLILERSGMAEDLLETIGQLFGPLRGGLAFAVIFVGALLAATTGVVAASVISMGLISLPIMLRYGYDRRFASGVIAASGTLAQIIPPSLVLIIMADQLGKSVGDMYAGAFIPGIALAGLYAVYALGVAFFRPHWSPALPPEARRLKDGGNMVGDREVVGLLFNRLLRPEYRDGVILDGFPRTKVQVECLKLLVEKMQQLRHEFYHTPLGIHFRQPTIHIMVLFVDEKTSIMRQLKRGLEVRAHNDEVHRTGIGELWEDRPTDHDEGLARRRYRVFKEQTWGALQELKEIYHYHFVNAQGPIEEVEQNILKELNYQSTLELDPRTFDRVRSIPLASEIIVHARQELVKRLDSYELESPELFQQVVGFIDKKVIPIVDRHAISGVAHVNTEDPVLDVPLALAMLIDVFSERGYHAVVDIHRIEVPERVDLSTGKICCRVKKVYRLQIRFQGSEIRRG